MDTRKYQYTPQPNERFSVDKKTINDSKVNLYENKYYGAAHQNTILKSSPIYREKEFYQSKVGDIA